MQTSRRAVRFAAGRGVDHGRGAVTQARIDGDVVAVVIGRVGEVDEVADAQVRERRGDAAGVLPA